MSYRVRDLRVTMASVLQIEDHPLVSFLPLDLTSTESLEVVVSHIDFTMQYGEDEEPKEVSPLHLYLAPEMTVGMAAQ